MAANVNRAISLMGGDDPGIRGPYLAVGQMGDSCSISDSSPLQDFVRAKKKINDIFVEIEDYAHDTVTYMQSVQQDGSIVKSDDAVQVKGHIAKVRGVRNVLMRNHMKVVFFGRTSNGKSSVINAMLCEKILPCCYGHTTNCFLQVEGSDSGEPYLVIEGSTEKQNVESVRHLANALCKEKLGDGQLVHIYWPKDKCLLLRDDVVFVDSPGIDALPNLDEGINSYCLDADIFVLVANAESTLTLAEKNFFHKVSTQLGKPNILILHNKWDAVVSEPDFLDEVWAQHKEQAVEFLVTQLNVCTPEEANQRIFFVSAKEALQARLQEQKGLPADTGAFPDGFPDRYSEFQDFERKFAECISKSAVRKKIEQYSQSGKLILSEILQIIDSLNNQAQQLKTQRAVAKKELDDKMECTKQQLSLLTQEMKDKIRQMVKDVEKRVFKALSEEIRRLSVLVDEFNLPFKPAQYEYKMKLHHHVENGLGSKLRAKLSTELEMNIENIQREMTERMSGLLPAEKEQVSLNALPQREPFEILYSLNCDNLCADFQENLNFRISGRQISAEEEGKAEAAVAVTTAATAAGTLVVEAATAALGAVAAAPVGAATSAAVQAAVAAAAAAATTPAVVGAAAIAGTFFVGKYLYKQLTWTNEAKEREFKSQFVAHVTKKEQQIVNSTSANCNNQVEQELSSTLAQLCHLVNEAVNDMDAEIKTLDKEIKQLEEAANSAEVLRNKANNIAKQLEIFDDEFLKLHN